MITLGKLKIYRSYKGDVDMFGLAARASEREIMTDAEFDLVDLLLQDATVISRNLGSIERTAQADERLSENCENQEVVLEIMRLAEKE